MKHTRRFLAVASIAATVGVGAPVLVNGMAEPADLGSTVTGCVIRFTDAGPRILDDDKHVCNGASAVSVNEHGELVITTTATGKVVTATVEEDETLSRRGIIAGPSVAVGTTRVSFYSTRTGQPLRADSDELKGDLANIWLTWVNATA